MLFPWQLNNAHARTTSQRHLPNMVTSNLIFFHKIEIAAIEQVDFIGYKICLIS